ncbi:hsp16-like protein, variant [Salpingoeca rosetta]|nr:hsp16-like protein, variant [Salpingoeca rosetta]EGD80962.1 hsp16-like protein, variant [Salpingoeca rosetta]|eukprot:XP_004997523.1 hsp16-like protein, variant [Salpingoeca rosetta]
MPFKYDPVTLGSKPSKAVHHATSPFMGPVDIYETDDSYVFITDCPGLSSKDVHVRVTTDLLQLSGERKQRTTGTGQHFHRMERSFGTFCRTFRLPAGTDVENVKATCEHGVLTVTVAKDKEFQEKQIKMADARAEEEGDGKLNPEFEAVPMTIFPTPALGKIVIINSDATILDAVKTLSSNHILSAPVRDVTQPEDASWTDKYIGMVDMVGIVFHMLGVLGSAAGKEEDFSKQIESVESFQKMQVKDAISFFRFGPFVPVDLERGNLLDCMLLCGHHGIRRVPVVKTPGGDIVNVITQSALVQTLEANLNRFKDVGTKTLKEVGLGDKGLLFTVSLDDPLRSAFEKIKENDISAVPVVDAEGKIHGNVSARDARLIVGSTKIYKLLDMPIKTYLDVVTDGAENSAITCKSTDKLETVISQLVRSRIHRIYVVDDDGRPLRVVSLRNVLTKFVKEPEGYFGHYFSY